MNLGFMQQFISNSQHKESPSLTMVESKARANNNAHEPLGISFHSPSNVNFPLFGDFFPCLYFELNCISNVYLLYFKWHFCVFELERWFSGSVQSSHLMEITFIFTWNILIVNLSFSHPYRMISLRARAILYWSVFLFLKWKNISPMSSSYFYYFLVFLNLAGSWSFLQHLVATTQTYENHSYLWCLVGLMKLCLNDGLKSRCRKQTFLVTVIRRKWKQKHNYNVCL